ADGEAEADALARRLGAEEWIEDARQVFRRNARAAVAYRDDRRGVFLPHVRVDASFAAHRLCCVQQDIEQHLLDLPSAREHRRAARAGVSDGYAGRLVAMAEQRDRRLHSGIERGGRWRFGSDTREVAELARDGEHARDVGADRLAFRATEHRRERKRVDDRAHVVADRKEIRLASTAAFHAAPRNAGRGIIRSSIGRQSTAAITDNAIEASHTSWYEPVASKIAPPAHAPAKAPSWCPRKDTEKRVDRNLTPKIWPTSELVSGTVASQVTPST